MPKHPINHDLLRAIRGGASVNGELHRPETTLLGRGTTTALSALSGWKHPVFGEFTPATEQLKRRKRH